jgi:hypothetical protein
MNKAYFSYFIDIIEVDLYKTVNENFDKRSSVTIRGGRPYSYSPKEIVKQMTTYFRDCVKYNRPLTITGLCLQLGVSREGLQKMEKSSNKELGDIIKKSKEIVEVYLEWQCHALLNPRFPIFVLKNMGWSDKGMAKIKVNSEMSGEARIEAQDRIKNFSE